MDRLTSESLLFGPVFVGLGCRRGCGWEEIAALVAAAFDEAALPDAVRQLQDWRIKSAVQQAA